MSQQPPDDRRPVWEGGTYFPPPSNPNQPSFNPQFPQQGNYPPQQGQSPQQRQPFNPQYPSGQYPPLPQQGYPPQGQFPPQFPQQQYQQPPMMQPIPPPQKKRGKGLLIGAIVAALVLFACIGASVIASRSATAPTSTTTSTKVGNTDSATPTAIPTQASSFKTGDMVKVGTSWEITIVSAKADAGNTIYVPKSGMRYLVLNIAMKNLTNANHTISSIIQFTLRGNDGTKYTVSIYPDAGSQIDGNVDGGQPAKGVIVYEVPTNVSSYHLTFESNPFSASDGRATWDLTI